jgi:hypothetical protein
MINLCNQPLSDYSVDSDRRTTLDDIDQLHLSTCVNRQHLHMRISYTIPEKNIMDSVCLPDYILAKTVISRFLLPPLNVVSF